MIKNIKKINCFILDMDGTIYLSDRLINGALDFLKTLDRQQKQYFFLTNNSSKNKKAYHEKLKKMGCVVDENRIFTSGEATAVFLKKKKLSAKIFLLGNKYLEEEFLFHGFNLVKDKNDTPDFVVLGFDTTITYDKIWSACNYIRDGIPYIATHPDINCPLANNKVMPDTGAMIEMIRVSTGKRPLIVGKPNSHIIDSISEKFSVEHNDMAMVGDRLYTDIQLAINANITSVLVLSGETRRQDIENSPYTPNHIFPSLKELNDALNL